MDFNENDITLVERFFESTLDEAGMREVAARLQNDAQFKALFEQEQMLVRAIRHQGLQTNLQYLRSLESTLDQNLPAPVRSSNQRWYYLAAAAVVGTLLVATFMLSAPEDPDKLFQAYFAPYPNVFEPTVRGNEQTTQRAEAFQAYEQQRYPDAAARLTQLYKEHPEPGVLLLLGNAQLAAGSLKEAEASFLSLIKDYDDLDLPAKWYLSLVYLKTGDVERAKNMLNELGDTEISYASKAKELLKKVN